MAFVCRDPDLLTSALDEFAALRMPAAESHQGMEDDHGGALMKTAVKKAQRAELLGLVTLNSVLSVSHLLRLIFRYVTLILKERPRWQSLALCLQLLCLVAFYYN